MRRRWVRAVSAAVLVVALGGCQGWYQVGYDMGGSNYNPQVEHVGPASFAIPELVYAYPYQQEGQPVTGEGLVFGTGRLPGQSTAIEDLFATDLDDGTLVWTASCNGVVDGARTRLLAQGAGRVFVNCGFGASETLVARDAASGALLYQRPGMHVRGIHAGLVVAVSNDGTTVAALYPDGTTAWTVTLSAPLQTIHAAGDAVWLSRDGTATALSILDGSVLREHTGMVGGITAVRAGRLYFTSAGEWSVRAVDAMTGELLWEYADRCTGGDPLVNGASIAVDDTSLVFNTWGPGSSQCYYGAIDVETGALRWRVTSNLQYLSYPTIADGVAFFYGVEYFGLESLATFAMVRIADGTVLLRTGPPYIRAGGTGRLVIADELLFARQGVYRFSSA